MNHSFDVAVIGIGMMGSAAARYLSAQGLRVLAIGPEEPADWQSHTGVFASHYDQGRITRISDPDPIWAQLAARSLAVYGEIELNSDVRFHHPVGHLRVSPDGVAPGDSLRRAAENAQQYGADYSLCSSSELAHAFPFLDFPAGAMGLWERGGAGFINPRALVRAQLTIAAQQGALIKRGTVTALARQEDGIALVTGSGDRYTVPRALVAAGGYTNHLLRDPLDLRPKAVSVVLAQLDEREVARLQGMPSLIWRLADHPVLASIYAAPPTLYPDGATYLKIGGTLKEPVYMYTPEAFRNWFHADGNPVETDALREVLLALLPGLRVSRWQTKPCVVTYTAHDYPYIDEIDAGIYVAAGGCGASAKSSNEIGRLAAELVATGYWRDNIDRALFRSQPAAGAG
ncbi:MAG: FAD-dependent oxidoreductase [Caldilineaceae bacterium]|nr:FAD-dependent oxidoreductase [Caldilineaceae bacterium]